jgi:hypothetical protein
MEDGRAQLGAPRCHSASAGSISRAYAPVARCRLVEMPVQMEMATADTDASTPAAPFTPHIQGVASEIRRTTRSQRGLDSTSSQSDRKLPTPAAIPNIAVETAKKDRWYQVMTDRRRVSRISSVSVLSAVRKRPVRRELRRTSIAFLSARHRRAAAWLAMCQPSARSAIEWKACPAMISTTVIVAVRLS